MWGGTALPADGCLCSGLPGELLLCCPTAAGCPPAAHCPWLGAQPSALGVPAWPRPLFVCGGGCQAGGCLLPTLPSIQFHQTSEIRKQLWLLALKELRGLRFPFGFCRLCRAILTPLFHSPAVSQRPPPAQRLLGAACAHRGPPPRNPPCPPPRPLAMDSARSPALRGAPTAHLGWRTPTWGGGNPPSFLPVTLCQSRH